MKLFISNPGGGVGGSGSLTGGGVVATGGYTLTVPATGTAALLGTAQSFTAAQTISVNGAASTPPLALTGTIFTGGSATTTKPALLIEPSGTTSTGWSTSGTGLGINLASGFTGNLLDLQKNGVRVFGVSDDGAVTACTGRGGTRFALYDFYSRMGAAGTDYFSVRNVATAELINGCALGFAAGTSADLYLHREAAGTLAQRNSTNAQTSRIYGTYTDTSNYTRLSLAATSTTMTIACETAGAGADDIDLTLTPAGAGVVRFGSHSAIGAETVTGYITIKDSGGTSRKIAVVS